MINYEGEVITSPKVMKLIDENMNFTIPIRILDEKIKIDLIAMLAETEWRLSQGATEEIQLNALLARISLLDEK